MSQPLVPRIILDRLRQSEPNGEIQRAKDFIQTEMNRIRKVLKEKASPATVEKPVEVPAEEPVGVLEFMVLNAPDLLSSLLSTDEYIQHLYIQLLHEMESL